jgi:hypothetical protein
MILPSIDIILEGKIRLLIDLTSICATNRVNKNKNDNSLLDFVSDLSQMSAYN